MKATKLFFGQFINMMVNNNKTVFYNNLPAAVKAFVSRQFPSLSVAFIEKDGSDYTLELNDGTKVTVSEDGKMKEMDYTYESALISQLPENITEDIKQSFSGVNIIYVQQNANGYVVELTNSVCKKYDRHGLAA